MVAGWRRPPRRGPVGVEAVVAVAVSGFDDRVIERDVDFFPGVRVDGKDQAGAGVFVEAGLGRDVLDAASPQLGP